MVEQRTENPCVGGSIPPLGTILALALLVFGVPTVARGQEPVNVVASEYQFAPNRLSFEHGVRYRLHVENHGKETHEFTAPRFFKAIAIEDPSALNADKTEIVVNPGEAKDLNFVANKPGHYRFICADHDWAGMKGKITVK